MLNWKNDEKFRRDLQQQQQHNTHRDHIQSSTLFFFFFYFTILNGCIYCVYLARSVSLCLCVRDSVAAYREISFFSQFELRINWSYLFLSFTHSVFGMLCACMPHTKFSLMESIAHVLLVSPLLPPWMKKSKRKRNSMASKIKNTIFLCQINLQKHQVIMIIVLLSIDWFLFQVINFIFKNKTKNLLFYRMLLLFFGKISMILFNMIIIIRFDNEIGYFCVINQKGRKITTRNLYYACVSVTVSVFMDHFNSER